MIKVSCIFLWKLQDNIFIINVNFCYYHFSLLLNKSISPENHIYHRMPRRYGNQYSWIPIFSKPINLGALFFGTTCILAQKGMLTINHKILETNSSFHVK